MKLSTHIQLLPRSTAHGALPPGPYPPPWKGWFITTEPSQYCSMTRFFRCQVRLQPPVCLNTVSAVERCGALWSAVGVPHDATRVQMDKARFAPLVQQHGRLLWTSSERNNCRTERYVTVRPYQRRNKIKTSRQLLTESPRY